VSARPALDPELAELLASLPEFAPLSAETLPLMRPYASAPVEPLLATRDVERREEVIVGQDGASLPLTVISPRRPTNAAPGVLWLHGGGMVMGDRFSQLDIPLEWLDELGAVVVSVDYRLAPEASGTTIVEDGYAALTWMVAHAAELGIDVDRVVVAGTSAGGGVAAGVVLLARDRKAPAVAAQVLICPMLDHRNETVSSHQFTTQACGRVNRTRSHGAPCGARTRPVTCRSTPRPQSHQNSRGCRRPTSTRDLPRCFVMSA